MKRKMKNWFNWLLFSFFTLTLLLACQKNYPSSLHPTEAVADTVVLKEKKELPPFDTIPIRFEVNVGCYFDFMDTLVRRYDTLAPYPISEHLIVWANPWIIDTLENTDYYRLMEKGIFNYDNRSLAVLKKGDTIFIPNRVKAEELLAYHQGVAIDVNIPEYKLRIFDGRDTLYTFPVRVGQNKRRYLEMSGRVTDLRTAVGEGSIVRINKNPWAINPVDNKRYKVTNRDDGRVTRIPQIPWLEPELNGQRKGHLIHPTTNPETLGKAYSNGCVGTTEAGAWRIYYYAPLDTKVVFRYDLDVVNEVGDTIRLKDIYGYDRRKKARSFSALPSLKMVASSD